MGFLNAVWQIEQCGWSG